MWSRWLGAVTGPGSVLVGLVLLLTLRIYPERVESGGSFLPPGRTPPPPRVSYERTSLAHVFRHGWQWRPPMCDAYERHQRSPGWLAIYAVLLPVVWGIGGVFWMLLRRLGRRVWTAIQRTRASRPRQIGIGLAGLSLMAHLIYVNHLRRGGFVNLSEAELLLHRAGDLVSVLLLPFTVVNRLLMLAAAWLNRCTVEVFLPAPQWPGIQIQESLFGAYWYNGFAWELFLAVLLVLVWLLLINTLCDFFAARAAKK